MPSTNHFKFGASGISSATRGGFSVGVTNGADYGPTSTTGFWNGVTPPVGGYTIYVDKASQGPSIHVAYDDAQCITILKAMGATGTTISDVLTWADGQSNMAILTAELTLGDLPTTFTLYVSANGNPAAVCASSTTITATGNSAVFCNCTLFYSDYFIHAGQPLYVRYGTQVLRLDNQSIAHSYDGYATPIGTCTTC